MQVSKSNIFLVATGLIFVWFVFYGHNSSSTTSSIQTGYNSKDCLKPGDWDNFMPQGRGKRVLVTGAAGFIGSHVAKFCARKLGMEVVAVDDLSGGFPANVDFEAVTFVKGDLKDDRFVEELFQKYGPFHAVYHLAAYAAEGMSHFIRRFNYRNNLVSSVSLLNQAVLTGVKTFVFTSSIAAYGAAQTPMVETTTPQPEDPYGVSKYAVELDLKSAHEMFGIDFVIFRPHNVYGPNQNIYDRYRNVIGIFMSQILRNLPLTVFGDGLQTRAFSYIDDVAPAIAISPLIPGARNQIFNVGGDQPYTLLELARVVSDAMGVSPNVKHLDARKEVMHAVADHSKIKCVFGLGEPVPLDKGIADVAAWVKATGKSFTPKEFDTVEVLTQMPPSWITPNMRENQDKKMKNVPIYKEGETPKPLPEGTPMSQIESKSAKVEKVQEKPQEQQNKLQQQQGNAKPAAKNNNSPNVIVKKAMPAATSGKIVPTASSANLKKVVNTAPGKGKNGK